MVFTFLRKCKLSILIKESVKVREEKNMYFMRVNKRLAVIFQTVICASNFAYPSKYGMTQGNFLPNKQFLIVYHILDIFTWGGLCSVHHLLHIF